MTVGRRNWSQHPWTLIESVDLEIERRQCVEEGKDVSALDAEFTALIASDLSHEANQQRAEALLDRTLLLPTMAGYVHREPSDLEGIRRERPVPCHLPMRSLTDAELLDKATGAWQGRAAGCLLGKPVEGRRSWQIEKYLKAQGRWPLKSYFSLTASAELVRECALTITDRKLFEEGITCMPEDDDTNYTVTGLALLKRHGAAFTPEHVAAFWLDNIPYFHVCTAERVAYRNLVAGIAPPLSASHRNVYREWIGAQIRADFFGYVNPGNPERAAEFAWRDACISHVKNGIYGEMWVAAMLAAAYVCDDIETVVRVGLAQVPATSRLAVGVCGILELKRQGASDEDAVADLHRRWHEDRRHDWCHTVSNAEIVTIALLWGGMDFGRTICLSVMPGFDTDCNGATSGSIMGVILGANRLSAEWIAPMRNTLLTGVAGYHQVSLTDLGSETVGLIRKNTR